MELNNVLGRKHEMPARALVVFIRESTEMIGVVIFVAVLHRPNILSYGYSKTLNSATIFPRR
jgi:hypothetical protein